jgi:response regulator of citrate/malate metabolism
MASIDIKILEAAYQDGLFKQPPTDRQNIYLRASVMSAWEIIEIIQARLEIGIEGEEIAKEMRMNHETIKWYLRWLVEKNLIEFETPKGDQSKPTQSRVYRRKL